MGILNQTQNQYYNNSSNFGNYQFTSLDDIINQFMVAYIGEEKIISKASRTDVQFHAMRALAELSFDTFKSIKSQEIELPPSLTMALPHDYVNYTKISWSDSAGIKHPLYPTNDTSNPFKIKQNTDGDYDFSNLTQEILINNNDFSSNLASSSWLQSAAKNTKDENGDAVGEDAVETNANDELEFKNFYDSRVSTTTTYFSHQYAVWQLIELDAETSEASLSADALSTAAVSGSKGVGIVRVGLSTAITGANTQNIASTYGPGTNYDPTRTHPLLPNKPSFNMNPGVFNLSSINSNTQGSYIEFNSGNNTLTEGTAILIDVSQIPLNANNKKEVYILIVSDNSITSNGVGTTSYTQKVDNITLSVDGVSSELISGGESTTWSNYKSQTPNENVNPEIYSYDTDIYDFNIGERYGLDPQHAQVNGSYYIDNLRGLINFSSNVSGKTVILDYISDSLGTDGEMQVHKFAEEAMYKSIMYAILSTRANTPEYVVRRYKKERFASIRQAKLRLSNIKLEEITQVFRGKSKHIKH
tara:strand:- start:342 stop:1931 length:1590 start_codon:yes stop_codon:yes gene_type:complete